MFDLTIPSAPPSYNVAPTHNVLAVRTGDAGEEAILLRWGLIPSWSKDKKTIFINARSETLAEKPAFRSAFKKRQCLIFADGYYEWKAVGKEKQPYYFRTLLPAFTKTLVGKLTRVLLFSIVRRHKLQHNSQQITSRGQLIRKGNVSATPRLTSIVELFWSNRRPCQRWIHAAG
jgi:hypothetical protein